jgi:hypothetical protein
MSEQIEIKSPTEIPSVSRGRRSGWTKYPLASLAVSVDGKGPSFEVELKTPASVYTAAKRILPDSKFKVVKLQNDDGSAKLGPKGKQLFGVWRVK